ncbi:WD40 repeat-like protein [Amylocystis lapponica]|nr:WD40 repeat-like protein [Amylocystis lapponica]
MLVPVDRAHLMAASTTQTFVQPSQDAQLPPSSEPRKRKRRAGREAGEKAGPKAGTSKAAADAPPAPPAPWSWKSLTDSSTSRVAPVFTKDGSYFFSAVGSSVKIHSVATGEIVSTLEPPSSSSEGRVSYSDAVTCAVLNPHNPYQLITGSSDGKIRIWDFLDAVLLQTINVSQSIYQLAAHEKFPGSVIVAAKKERNGKGNGTASEDSMVVLRVSLNPTSATARLPIQVSAEVSHVGRTRATTGLAFSPSGAWLVATAGHKAYVCSTADFKAGFTKFVSPQSLTCLAFSPSEEYFATGDSTGCIRLWYCLNERATVKTVGVEKTAQTTTLHWHAHAVSSLAFTANGAYLLSGGEESVLVIWQLHTGKKEFVPRVGAPVVHVALSTPVNGEEEYLLSLADASFVFINSGTLKISRSMARIKLDPAISHSRPSASTAVPLAVHPSTSTLILPSSHPSSLQTFAPSTSKLLSEIEVSPSNRVSRRDEKPLEPSRVECVVMSDSGEWMTTIDSRVGDEAFRGEVYLKIWWWDHKSEYWILNTRIDRPHGLMKVTGVAFNPGMKTKESLLLVTTGSDGNIKTWRIRSMKTKSGGSDAFWVARSTFRFRSEIPTHVSWSPDGSLFAVSVGLIKAVSSARFVGRNGRYLAVTGVRDLMLWDLVTQSMRWQHHSSGAIERLVPHPREDTFALFVHPPRANSDPPMTSVYVFRPSSPSPSSTWTLPFHLLNVSHVPRGLAPSKPASFSLVGITHAWSVVVFGDEVTLLEDEGAHARRVDKDGGSRRRTLFQDIFGKSAFADFAPESSTSTAAPDRAQPWRGKEVAAIFDAPAYLMPPLEMVFDTVMDGFFTARSAEDAAENQDQEDEDAVMDVDEDDAPVVPAPRIERVVDKTEMDALVTSSSSMYSKHLHRPNQRPHTNAAASPSPSPLAATKLNGGVSKLQTLSSAELSPLVKTGKKRKKSQLSGPSEGESEEGSIL